MTRSRWCFALLFAWVLSCKGDQPATSPEPVADPEPVAHGSLPAHLLAAVAFAGRATEDRERDVDRKPAEVMAFFGIEPGMKVAELMSGRGYYAELLARAVGSAGTLYAQNNRFVLERFARADITARLAKPGLENAKLWERELDKLDFPAGELDAVLMILFYHDTYWQKVPREAMLAAVFAGLKHGGIFGVVDHHAAAGAGVTAVQTLHRVEASVVKAEILAAGFELAGESELLRMPADDRTINVFKPEIRGKTDRFIYKFRKP